MSIETQTEGFIAVGDLPNDERYRCLLCKCVPERVIVDLFIPAPKDIPAGFPLPDSKTLVLPYRLCPQCSKARPDTWKIRLFMLERLNSLMERRK
jgi:hypothetical protein